MSNSKIESYSELMGNLDSILWAAQEEGRLTGHADLATMEFVVGWFQANEDQVDDWFNEAYEGCGCETPDVLSGCCGAPLTYLDDGSGHWVLCCRKCHDEVYEDGSVR